MAAIPQLLDADDPLAAELSLFKKRKQQAAGGGQIWQHFRPVMVENTEWQKQTEAKQVCKLLCTCCGALLSAGNPSQRNTEHWGTSTSTSTICKAMAKKPGAAAGAAVAMAAQAATAQAAAAGKRTHAEMQEGAGPSTQESNADGPSTSGRPASGSILSWLVPPAQRDCALKHLGLFFFKHSVALMLIEATARTAAAPRSRSPLALRRACTHAHSVGRSGELAPGLPPPSPSIPPPPLADLCGLPHMLARTAATPRPRCSARARTRTHSSAVLTPPHAG